MFRQVRLINPRAVAVQRSAVRTYAIDTTPKRPYVTPASLPPKTPTALNSGVRAIPAVAVPADPTIPAKPVVVVSSTTTNIPAAGTIPTPGGVGAAAPVKPLNDDLPPPPPPPPSGGPKRSRTRRYLLWLTFGTLLFYPTSALLSTHFDGYRELFTQTFPGAEALVDYAEENDWDRLTFGGVVNSAKGLGERAGGLVSSAKESVGGVAGGVGQKTSGLGEKAKEVVQDGKENVKKTAGTWSEKLEAARAEAGAKLEQAKKDVKAATTSTTSSVKDNASIAEKKASAEAEKLKLQAKDAADKAAAQAQSAVRDIKEGVKHATETVKEKVVAGVEALPVINFSDGVAELVEKAEGALGRVEKKVVEGEKRVEEVVKEGVTLRNKGGVEVDPREQAVYVDTQRPRDVKAEPTSTAKEVKLPYPGQLPLGFEPPAGYFVPKPVTTTTDEALLTTNPETADPKIEGQLPSPPKPTLPLLAPRVAEFTSASDEPIITQLATTIDNLASSLSATSSAAPSLNLNDSSNPESILSKASEDLSSLSARLQSLKDEEKRKLEVTAEEKRREFERVLEGREREWEVKEGDMKEGWREEREKLVEGWRKVLDRELEGQRVGIEQRLREEVIAQGIELQRRWLRSIKAQVEQERGGRLAKLDNLTTSFKQLERITLDNSSQLDANVSLHTLWSALRAVQAKVDKGGVAFDDELRVLKTAASSAAAVSSDEKTKDILGLMIQSIEQSGAASEGIKSFASLSSWFSSTVSPKIQSVSLVPAEHEAGVLSHIASAGLSKLLFRPKAGWVEGDDVGAVLARAEYLLNEKDLDGAARQVNQLKGWAGKLAGDWLREARKRLEVEQAVQVMATEATLSSLLLV